jgi:xanthine permease
MTYSVHPVDERLPIARLVPLAIQHVLVMYAGAVAVPLIIGRAVNLPPEQVSFLISADLFACGLATIVQSMGFPGVGIRLPVMMGVTFASVGPMLSMAATPGIGLLGIYGAVIGAGIFGVLAAPFISRLLPMFPPVVTGTIILVIGISLMRVGINWAGGGLQTFTKVVDGTPATFPNPGFGQLTGLGVALFVLVVILSLIEWGQGFVANVAVLLGIVAGAVLAAAIGLMHFEKVATAHWIDIVLPFHFGVPEFHSIPIITMCVVMVVVMIESLGMFLALGEITGKSIDQASLTRGLRADGIGTILGGIFNTFPYTSFSQNVGLVGVTGVRSRWITVTGFADARAGGAAKDVGTGRGSSAGRVGWRGPGDVRHGRRNWRAYSDRRELQVQPQQPVHRCCIGWVWDDPAGRAGVLPQPSA